MRHLPAVLSEQREELKARPRSVEFIFKAHIVFILNKPMDGVRQNVERLREGSLLNRSMPRTEAAESTRVQTD